MSYETYEIMIPQDKREEINAKILAVIDGQVKDHEITPEDIFNSYTGRGGLHGLDFSDFDNYHQFSRAKKEYEIGQFFTPPHICRQLVNLVKPEVNALVCDPTCGTGNFFNFMPRQENCFGCEIDTQAFKVAHFLYPDAKIVNRDIRAYRPDVSFDYIFGNPPFNLDFSGMPSQLYFCLKSADLLKPGGLLVFIAPLSFLNDDFANKSMIEQMNREFNFVLQYPLPPASFKALGIDHFETKILIFQKKSQHLDERPYVHDAFVSGFIEDLFDSHIAPLKQKNKEQRAKMLLESAKDKDGFDYQVNKLLYQVKTNKKTAPDYARCLEKVNTLKTQEKPYDLPWPEWEKAKLTPNKVIAYLRKVLKKQHLTEVD